MSLQSTHTLTAAELEARRQNAQKSSGPRTPAGKRFSRLNATRHGHYAAHYSEAFRETLLILKEDPEEYERLRQRLLASFPAPEASDGSQPLLPILTLAVEELAQLHWELDRERRCQNRMRQRRLDALDDMLHKRRAEVSSDKYEDRFDRPPHEPGGLEAAPPSANRYKAILYHLSSLLDQVDRGDFQNYHRSMWLLYDDCAQLSVVGHQILDLFCRLSGKYSALPPPDENSPQELRALLVQEREKYAREYEDFKPFWPAIFDLDRERARNLEWLEERDRELLDESREREEWLRRAIDRKLRTIVAIGRKVRLEARCSTGVSPVSPTTGLTRESRLRAAHEPQKRKAHDAGRKSDQSAPSGSTGVPPVSRTKNEGTNRGTHLESTNPLPAVPPAERRIGPDESDRSGSAAVLCGKAAPSRTADKK